MTTKLHSSVTRADPDNHAPGTVADYLPFTDQTGDPAPPASGHVVYTKAGGAYVEDAAGTVTALGLPISPATTVTDETALDGTPVVGTGTDYARADHKHGTPSTATIAAVAEAQIAAASGVDGGFAPLSSGLLIPVAYLGSGTPDGTKFLRDDGTFATPSGGSLTVSDEGTPLATDATTLDFVGAGVTASGTGATKTITIPGGSAADITDIPAAETDTSKRLAPDGAGGVGWVAGGASFVGCSLRKATAQAITSGAVWTATFDTEDIDNGGYHSGANPTKIIIPTGGAGIYLFGGFIHAAAATTAKVWFYLAKNQAAGLDYTLAGAQVPINTDTQGAVTWLSAPISCADADYFVAGGWTNWTGSVDVRFWCMRIG